jgi:hypothetical protein
VKDVFLAVMIGLSVNAAAVSAADYDRLSNGAQNHAAEEAGTATGSTLPGSALTARKKEEGRIVWQEWSDDTFAHAKKSNRYVLLDLEAVWCHWCHVMDEKTYKDPAIIKLVNERFVPVRVDQDSRPDLSNRYDDYGWPATVVFDSAGKEKAIWSGYIPPEDMVSMLRSALKEKTVLQLQPKQISSGTNAALPANLRQELEKRISEGYDTKSGGWGFSHKFLDWDCVEYAMVRARAGDALWQKRAKETLTLEERLIDPVWGGVYQYSTDGDWVHPHFEKIMQMQAENLRIYAQAYGQWHDPAYLKAAKDIERYLSNFLTSPEGAFYTSQDADLVQGKHSGSYFALADAERKKRGIPRIDKHIYARENGWAISALCWLYMVTGDEAYLHKAERAADWILTNRSISQAGFCHDVSDKAGPYLGDTLAMGRACLSLYMATGDRRWLERAKEAANFVNEHFRENDKEPPGAGFATADLSGNSAFKPGPLLEENVNVARFANLLFHYTGNKAYHAMAESAMRYLAVPEVARKRTVYVAGILLADDEIGMDPPHVTVVGSKKDFAARSLFQAALKYPASYKRVEWWDPEEGPLPFMDVEYPQLKEAAAFTCVNGRCSAPIYRAELVTARLEEDGSKEVR